MRELSFQTSFLQVLYLIIFFVLFSFIIFTPKLISGSVHVTDAFVVDEEIVEGSLLGILFTLSILIFKLYKQEVRKQEELIKKIRNDKRTTDEKLLDSMNYIGKVNVQIEEIKSIFNTTNKYPETKNDYKKSFRFLSERVLGIVNTNWVLLRIINSDTRRTISECFETRHGHSFRYPHISNKMIVENQMVASFTTVITNPPNLNILVCCTLPIDEINRDQRIFIQAIINEITMLFVILNSAYYQNETKIITEKKTLKKEKTNSSI